MGLSRYKRAGVIVRAIGHEMIVPTIGVALPPDLATRLPERDHELEDVAGDRVLRGSKSVASARLGYRGAAFVTVVAFKLSRDHLTALK